MSDVDFVTELIARDHVGQAAHDSAVPNVVLGVTKGQ